VKILITGSDGQLGHSLVAALGEDRVEAAGHNRLNITSLAAVRGAIERLAPEIVINAAAYSDVDGAEIDRVQAYRVNALGPRNLALATSSSAGIPLAHFSTDYVFDGASGRPYHEYDEPRPILAYGAASWPANRRSRS
jgi:dTDP-4-dehydrorhamnose reductase